MKRIVTKKKKEKEKGAFHDFNWVEAFSPALYVKKFKLKQVVFPSDKNSFFKEKIRYTFIVHILTLREKTNCNNTVTAALRQDTISTPQFRRGYIFRSKKRSDHYLHPNFRAHILFIYL